MIFFLINLVYQIPIYSKFFLVIFCDEYNSRNHFEKRKNVLQSLYFPKVYSDAGLYTQIYSFFKSKMKINVLLLRINLIWVYITELSIIVNITELSIIVIAKLIIYLIWLSILSEWSLISKKALIKKLYN